MTANPSTELRCSHSRLTVTDSVMRVHSVEPCLFCERDRLRESNAALLSLARQYASECSECDGEGNAMVTFNDGEPEFEPCEECASIRAVIAKAEGRT